MFKTHAVRLAPRRAIGISGGLTSAVQLMGGTVTAFSQSVQARYLFGGGVSYPDAWLVFREAEEQAETQYAQTAQLTQITLRLLLQLSKTDYIANSSTAAESLYRSVSTCLTILKAQDWKTFRELRTLLERVRTAETAWREKSGRKAVKRELRDIRETVERRLSFAASALSADGKAERATAAQTMTRIVPDLFTEPEKRSRLAGFVFLPAIRSGEAVSYRPIEPAARLIAVVPGDPAPGQTQMLEVQRQRFLELIRSSDVAEQTFLRQTAELVTRRVPSDGAGAGTLEKMIRTGSIREYTHLLQIWHQRTEEHAEAIYRKTDLNRRIAPDKVAEKPKKRTSKKRSAPKTADRQSGEIARQSPKNRGADFFAEVERECRSQLKQLGITDFAEVSLANPFVFPKRNTARKMGVFAGLSGGNFSAASGRNGRSLWRDSRLTAARLPQFQRLKQETIWTSGIFPTFFRNTGASIKPTAFWADYLSKEGEPAGRKNHSAHDRFPEGGNPTSPGIGMAQAQLVSARVGQILALRKSNVGAALAARLFTDAYTSAQMKALPSAAGITRMVGVSPAMGLSSAATVFSVPSPAAGRADKDIPQTENGRTILTAWRRLFPAPTYNGVINPTILNSGDRHEMGEEILQGVQPLYAAQMLQSVSPTAWGSVSMPGSAMGRSLAAPYAFSEESSVVRANRAVLQNRMTARKTDNSTGGMPIKNDQIKASNFALHLFLQSHYMENTKLLERETAVRGQQPWGKSLSERMEAVPLVGRIGSVGGKAQPTSSSAEGVSMQSRIPTPHLSVFPDLRFSQAERTAPLPILPNIIAAKGDVPARADRIAPQVSGLGFTAPQRLELTQSGDLHPMRRINILLWKTHKYMTSDFTLQELNYKLFSESPMQLHFNQSPAWAQTEFTTLRPAEEKKQSSSAAKSLWGSVRTADKFPLPAVPLTARTGPELRPDAYKTADLNLHRAHQETREGVADSDGLRETVTELRGQVPELKVLRRQTQEQGQTLSAQKEAISGLKTQLDRQEALVKAALERAAPSGGNAVEVRKIAKAVMKEMDSQLRLERQRRGLI